MAFFKIEHGCIMNQSSGEFYQGFDTEKKIKYYFYIPNDLGLIVEELEIDAQLSALLVQAHRELGILEGMTKYMQSIASYENMLICHESQYSCAVDGIISSCWDNREDNKAAHKCYQAIKSIYKTPISSKQICELQTIIMREEQRESDGKIRDKQFFMNPNYTINMQEYNPPHPQVVEELLDDLIVFIAEDDTVDVLIRAALVFYQFETIHPFVGGNGRVGRILPSMLLMQKRILARPILFLSKYFFDNNDECINWFRRVQFLDDFTGWIKYFIQGIIESVQMTIRQLEQADAIRVESKRKINTIKASSKATLLLNEILDYIEQTPIVSVKEIAENFQIAYNTAAKSIDILVDLKILRLVNEQARYREYYYEKYVDSMFKSLI